MDSMQKIPERRLVGSRTVAFPLSPIKASLPLPYEVTSQSRAVQKKKGRPFLFGLTLFFASVLLALGLLGFFVSKGMLFEQTIHVENKGHVSFFSQLSQLTSNFFAQKRTLLKGEAEGRINILLLGRAGEHYPGRDLTDTVMIMSIDTATKKIALLSLPRDLYVPIGDGGYFTKLNALYQYGQNRGEGAGTLRQTVEHITGLPIHYFFTLDFDGFEKVVDTLGGIDVKVLRDFYDPRYPGKNYSYETFEIHKGYQKLDGITTLKYVRERHNDPEGDFGRAKRQQQVIQAIKDKAFSLGTVFNIFTINKLIDTLGESIKTDMSLTDIESLFGLVKMLDTENVAAVVIDAWKKDSLLRVSHVAVGDIAAFVLVPRVGNWSELQERSKQIFHLDALRERRAQIEEEKPTVSLRYVAEYSSQATKMKELLETEMGFTSVILLPPALEKSQGKSIILDRTALAKPYSLDELLKKFSLEKMTTLSYLSPKKDTADFVIVLGDDLAETLGAQTLEGNVPPDDNTFSEPLPPQHKK